MYRNVYCTRRILTILIVLAGSLCLTRISLAQTTRYVAPHGSDTGNDCTDSFAPCASVAHAIAQSAAGNTIDVAAGIYTEPGLLLEQNVTIRGAGMDETVIQGAAEQPGIQLLKANGVVELERRITTHIEAAFRKSLQAGKASNGAAESEAAEFRSLKSEFRSRQRAAADAMASSTAGKPPLKAESSPSNRELRSYCRTSRFAMG